MLRRRRSLFAGLLLRRLRDERGVVGLVMRVWVRGRVGEVGGWGRGPSIGFLGGFVVVVGRRVGDWDLEEEGEEREGRRIVWSGCRGGGCCVLYAGDENVVFVSGGDGNWKRKLGGREVFHSLVSWLVFWGMLPFCESVDDDVFPNGAPSTLADCGLRGVGDRSSSVGGS